MFSFREYLRKGNFKKPIVGYPVTEDGWFDLEEYIEHGNYFLLKQGRSCKSKKR